MPIQTTFPFQHGELLKGMAVQSPERCITGHSDEVIEFGLGLVYDGAFSDGDRPKVAIPSATGFVFMGIALFAHKQSRQGDDGFGVLEATAGSRYEIGDDITILCRGLIQVYSEVAVNPTLPVFLRHTVNSALTPGNFRTDADTHKADALSGVKWATTTSGAGLAILELNLP